MAENHRYLIIGGTTKGATTSLFNYLSAHPEVCASSMKETRFLLDREYPLLSRYRFDDGLDKYEEFFGHCEDRKVRVEATPDYLYSPGTPRRIKDCFPQARVLFALREPLSRLVSWYKFSRQYDPDLRNITFDDYVALQKVPSPGRKQHMLALEQGKYSLYLRPYFETLGRDRVLVVFFEELSESPLSVMAGICSFAGIDAAFFSDFDFRVFNRTGVTRSARFHGLYRGLKYNVRKYTHDKPAVHSILKRIRTLVEPGYSSGNSSPEMGIGMSENTKAFLKDYYSAEAGCIEAITGTRVPWRDLG